MSEQTMIEIVTALQDEISRLTIRLADREHELISVRAERDEAKAMVQGKPKRTAPVLADHFFVPDKRPLDRSLSGVSVIHLCGACHRPGVDHPRRPRQEHEYIAGTKADPDYDYLDSTMGPAILCVTCERPRWEHPGPTVASALATTTTVSEQPSSERAARGQEAGS